MFVKLLSTFLKLFGKIRLVEVNFPDSRELVSLMIFINQSYDISLFQTHEPQKLPASFTIYYEQWETCLASLPYVIIICYFSLNTISLS